MLMSEVMLFVYIMVMEDGRGARGRSRRWREARTSASATTVEVETESAHNFAISRSIARRHVIINRLQMEFIDRPHCCSSCRKIKIYYRVCQSIVRLVRRYRHIQHRA